MRNASPVNKRLGFLKKRGEGSNPSPLFFEGMKKRSSFLKERTKELLFLLPVLATERVWGQDRQQE
jgi:hypothetical protein